MLLTAAYLPDHGASYEVDISASHLPLSSLRHPFLSIYVQVKAHAGGTETKSEGSFAILNLHTKYMHEKLKPQT